MHVTVGVVLGLKTDVEIGARITAFLAHALGTTGRARRVEHQAARLRIVDLAAVVLAERALPRLEALDRAADRESSLQARGKLRRTGRGVGEPGVGNERGRF